MPEKPSLLVAVVLQKLLPWNGQQSLVLAAALDQVVERWGAQIVFIPFGQYALDGAEQDGEMGTDLTTTLHVHEQMKHRPKAALLRTRHPPRDLMAAIGQCDLVLSMRYHGLVMAAAMGVPCIALTYRAETKLRSFMAQLGSPDDVLEMETLTQDALEPWIDNVLIHLQDQDQAILHRASALAASSRQGAQLLARFISKQSSSISVTTTQREQPTFQDSKEKPAA